MTAVQSRDEAVLAAGAVPDHLGPTATLVVAAAVIGYLTARARVRAWIALAGGLHLVLATGAGVGSTLALGGSRRDGVFTGTREAP